MYSTALMRYGISRYSVRGEYMDESIKVTGTWHFIWTDKSGKELRRRTEKNLVVASGLVAYAAILANELAQNCAVYLAMGTGVTAAANGDTKLETETTRKIITTLTRNSGTLIYRFYFFTGEAVGDFTELGVFLEATSAADRGRLLNRVLPVGGISKTSNEQLIIEVQVALAAA